MIHDEKYVLELWFQSADSIGAIVGTAPVVFATREEAEAALARNQPCAGWRITRQTVIAERDWRELSGSRGSG